MRTLCVDFDGVLHSYTSGWKGVDRVDDPPVPGSMAWLVECAQNFDEVCIYSSRSKETEGIVAMREAIFQWLREELRYSESEADTFIDTRLTFPKEKPAAWLTVDDRAICFDGTFPSMRSMLDFKPWNKRIEAP